MEDMQVINEISRVTGVKYSDEQLKILQHKGGMCILACAGSGKALDNNTGILTPNGYIAIGDIKVGDEVYDEKGDIQKVIGVYPQGKKKVNRVYFDNDIYIDCCSEHLWTYCSDSDESYKTTSTKELIKLINDKSLTSNKYYIPVAKPIKQTKSNNNGNEDYTGGIVKCLLGISVEEREAYINEYFKDSDIITLSSKELVDYVSSVCELNGYTVRVWETEDSIWQLQLIKNEKLGIKYIEEKDNNVPMTCIKVSGSSELFLTEHCIVTHNTTVLTHLLAKRIKTGEISDTSKLLCTTYSKAGSTEMEDRMNVLFNKLGIKDRVSVKTMHATYYAILKQFGLLGKVCSNTQRSIFISQAIREAGLRLEDEDIQLVDSLLSFQVNNLLDDANLVKSYVFTLEDVTLEQYSTIRQLYAKKKQEAGVIDFDDMQMYVYMLLVHQKNQAVIDFCRNKWEYFFIDEFQDISKIQFEILRQMITSPDKLICIGDDDQAIYAWRGADPNIILNICGYYDIQKFVLSTNYRCAGEIVNKASVGIKNNVKRADKEMIPFNSGGSIKICKSNCYNIYSMSKSAYNYIMRLVNEERVNVSDIAVLSRNNKHLAILNNMLFRAGIFSEASEEIKFTKLTMYKDLRYIMEIAEGTYNHNLVSKVLWKITLYMGVKNGTILSSLMDSVGCSFIDALDYALHIVMPFEFSAPTNIKVPDKLRDKLVYRLSMLKGDTIRSMHTLYKILQVEDEADRVSALFEVYRQCTEFMNKSNDKSRTVEGLISYINEMIKSEGLDGAKRLLTTTEHYESGNMEVPEDKISLSTMHGAKGREWKYVILFANDNITFPSFEGISKMVEDGIDTKDISNSIDENRRLSYVGWTRAKEELLLITDPRNMSLYSLEALGYLEKSNSSMNGHIIGTALNGYIDDDIVSRIEKELFSEDSPYYINCDKDIDSTDALFGQADESEEVF